MASSISYCSANSSFSVSNQPFYSPSVFRLEHASTREKLESKSFSIGVQPIIIVPSKMRMKVSCIFQLAQLMRLPLKQLNGSSPSPFYNSERPNLPII